MSIELFTLNLVPVWGAVRREFSERGDLPGARADERDLAPSRCPGCENKLAIYDNVPVLGWLWLRGKCRHCKMNISVQYPLVERRRRCCSAG